MTRSLLLISAVALMSVMLFGCSKDEPSVAERANVREVTADPQPAPGTEVEEAQRAGSAELSERGGSQTGGDE